MFFGQLTGVWEITDTTRHSTAKEYQYLRGGYSGETSKGRACTAQRGNFRTIRSPETARRFTPVWRQTSRSVHWRGALDAHAGLGHRQCPVSVRRAGQGASGPNRAAPALLSGTDQRAPAAGQGAVGGAGEIKRGRQGG